MQEAFGGTFMLKLFMIFFVIYVAFIGVALNFAKIYRIKNNVINILEQSQYKFEKGTGPGETVEQVSNYLKGANYGFKFNTVFKAEDNCPTGDKNLRDDEGVCVIKRGEDAKPYYTVRVYYVIQFPLFGLTIPISASGETIVIDT